MVNVELPMASKMKPSCPAGRSSDLRISGQETKLWRLHGQKHREKKG